jgi:hypothetical protein
LPITSVPTDAAGAVLVARQIEKSAQRGVWLAYLLLLVGSGYFLVRSLLDLGVVRKPVFLPNLNTYGLAWLGSTLLIVLSLKILLPATEPVPESGTTSIMLEKAATVATQAAATVNQTVVEPDRAVPVRLIGAGLTIACHAVVVVGLVWIGCRHFQNSAAGMAGAVLYLLLPYTAFHATDLQHVFPAALMTSLLVFHRWPVLTGILLGFGAGTVYFPVLLVPVWLSFYRHRGAGRFLLAFLVVAAGFGSYLILDESLRPYLQHAMNLPDWRAWDLSARPTGDGFWTGLDLHYAYRVPIFVGYVVLVLVAALWPNPKNLGHVIALSAALVLGIQFWYADAGGIYVLWYAPLLILMFVRPNLSQKYPPPLNQDVGWLREGVNWAWKHLPGKARQPVAASGVKV